MHNQSNGIKDRKKSLFASREAFALTSLPAVFRSTCLSAGKSASAALSSVRRHEVHISYRFNVIFDETAKYDHSNVLFIHRTVEFALLAQPSLGGEFPAFLNHFKLRG